MVARHCQHRDPPVRPFWEAEQEGRPGGAACGLSPAARQPRGAKVTQGRCRANGSRGSHCHQIALKRCSITITMASCLLLREKPLVVMLCGVHAVSRPQVSREVWQRLRGWDFGSGAALRRAAREECWLNELTGSASSQGGLSKLF